eukprot:15337874-Ditylum_brightwellii.AAC.1
MTFESKNVVDNDECWILWLVILLGGRHLQLVQVKEEGRCMWCALERLAVTFLEVQQQIMDLWGGMLDLCRVCFCNAALVSSALLLKGKKEC